MIPLDELQEMEKEELIKAFLRFQQEYASQTQMYNNLANENAAIQWAIQQERKNYAALQQEHAALRQEHANLQNEHTSLKAAHVDLQNQRPKRRWFLGLFGRR
jgi:predicted nuclease with TOPRIM domain